MWHVVPGAMTVEGWHGGTLVVAASVRVLMCCFGCARGMVAYMGGARGVGVVILTVLQYWASFTSLSANLASPPALGCG